MSVGTVGTGQLRTPTTPAALHWKHGRELGCSPGLIRRAISHAHTIPQFSKYSLSLFLSLFLSLSSSLGLSSTPLPVTWSKEMGLISYGVILFDIQTAMGGVSGRFLPREDCLVPGEMPPQAWLLELLWSKGTC